MYQLSIHGTSERVTASAGPGLRCLVQAERTTGLSGQEVALTVNVHNPGAETVRLTARLSLYRDTADGESRSRSRLLEMELPPSAVWTTTLFETLRTDHEVGVRAALGVYDVSGLLAAYDEDHLVVTPGRPAPRAPASGSMRAA